MGFEWMQRASEVLAVDARDERGRVWGHGSA